MKDCLAAFPELQPMVRSASRLLIACDFDGMLCDFLDCPDEAVLAPGMRSVLQALTSSVGVTVAIISSRELADVCGRCPGNIIVGGNCGLQLRGPGIVFEHRAAASFRRQIAETCDELNCLIGAWPGAWIEFKKLSASVHFRHVHTQRSELLLSVKKCLSQIAPQLVLRDGRETLDLFPPVDWDKGRALEHICREMGPFDRCICLGDDVNDESMFRMNEDNLNISVGDRSPSGATYCLAGPQEVEYLLRTVVSWKDPRFSYLKLLRNWGPDALDARSDQCSSN